MAKAEQVTQTLITINLQMSLDEANAVLSVLSRIGGTWTSRRRYIHETRKALEAAGVKSDTSDLRLGDCLYFI